jgi:hypothetical protein
MDVMARRVFCCEQAFSRAHLQPYGSHSVGKKGMPKMVTLEEWDDQKLEQKRERYQQPFQNAC